MVFLLSIFAQMPKIMTGDKEGTGGVKSEGRSCKVVNITAFSSSTPPLKPPSLAGG
jgi:hypothetical protein